MPVTSLDWFGGRFEKELETWRRRKEVLLNILQKYKKTVDYLIINPDCLPLAENAMNI